MRAKSSFSLAKLGRRGAVRAGDGEPGGRGMPVMGFWVGEGLRGDGEPGVRLTPWDRSAARAGVGAVLLVA